MEWGEPGDRRLDRELIECDGVDDRVIDRATERPVNPEAARRVALRVKVNDEDSISREREIAREVHNCGGLSDAALLVRAGDRLAHSGPHPSVFHRTRFYHQEALFLFGSHLWSAA